MIKNITILVDNESWILPYAKKLVSQLKSHNFTAHLCRDQNKILEGDVCFFLGCTKLVSTKNLEKNTINLVIHESDLPKGKGFAPMSWQIISGEKNIVVSLIEAIDGVDAGNIWLQDTIKLNGTELHDEWRHLQGECSVNLSMQFILNHENLKPIKQEGEPSFYKRRTARDSKLDINKTIAEQFNLLRVVDNENYPAYFIINDTKYKIKISTCE
ncbi:formyltransferase family protein [Colwellia sp. 4_MG-2023]|uniref:formyltransferase family protein n=1 Tax=unclassified Colwellia TaxID=196834 RepID=UPI0026E18271|nr:MULTISPECIES: formyltransferase family protein [unclassified Colwellia]MDO6507252.1 formyltransferase family protein [Colwellia sp. 5_MG-2023]MDO6555404.1 formyltransferase family protein [Colwellia sp. 4_MG-2023]